MCLGVPGQIVELKSSTEAVVDFWGRRKCISIAQLSGPPALGDYIIEHAGSAIRVIPPQDVADTLGLYEVLLCEAGEDPIAVDADCALATELEEPAFA